MPVIELLTHKRIKLAVPLLLSVTLAACAMLRREEPAGGGYYQSDGPPKAEDAQRANVEIADAQPRLEPFSKTGNKPYKALGKNYRPLSSAAGFSERGKASWYGKQFHGRRTSSGETYDMYKMTAAHPTLPLPTYVHVQNLDNGRETVVRVNDRGPFKKGRVIDLSYAAASKLGVIRTGTARVAIRAITPESNVKAIAGHTVNNVSTQPIAASNNITEVVGSSANNLRHFVQAGAFSSFANAQKFQRQLADRGYQPLQTLSPEQAGGRFYKVRVGPIESSAVAEDFRLKLSRSLAVDAVVVVE